MKVNLRGYFRYILGLNRRYKNFSVLLMPSRNSNLYTLQIMVGSVIVDNSVDLENEQEIQECKDICNDLTYDTDKKFTFEII